MSETLTTWLYPTNWDGEYMFPDGSEMPYGWKRMRVNFKYYDDSANGTDESGVVKLVRADMKTVDGTECYMLQVDKIEYNTYGMDVIIVYDMDGADQTIARLPQSQANTMVGPWRPDIGPDGAYAGGETGNIKFTTMNASQYDYYDITLDITIVGWPRRLL